MANKITPLINGQEIRIDNHLRGTVNNFNNPNQDVHLHKTTVVGKRVKIDIRIPLNSDKEASFEVLTQQNNDEKKISKVVKEIKEVLADKEAVDKFINEIVDVLQTGWQANKSEDLFWETTKKIASAFGLENRYQYSFIKDNNQSLILKFIDIFEDLGKYYFVLLTTEEIVIGELAGRNKRLNLLVI